MTCLSLTCCSSFLEVVLSARFPGFPSCCRSAEALFIYFHFSISFVIKAQRFSSEELDLWAAPVLTVTRQRPGAANPPPPFFFFTPLLPVLPTHPLPSTPLQSLHLSFSPFFSLLVQGPQPENGVPGRLHHAAGGHRVPVHPLPGPP